MAEVPGQWPVEKVVLWFWVGRRFGNGEFLEATFALTERCSRPRCRAAAELEALGRGDFSLHPDRLAGLLSAIPSLLKLPSLGASPGSGIVWRKHPAGGKLKKLCYDSG